MATSQPRTTSRPGTEKLYKAVRDEYTRLKDIKKKGVQLYSQEYIIVCISEKFYRSPKTVENIVYNRV